MARPLIALASGALFGIGLVVSGMTQPAVIVAFLDFTGDWNPSLLFVMGGAVGTFLLIYKLATRRETPILGGRFDNLPPPGLDARLLIGASLFGIGWGLAGYCPGPGLTSAASGAPQPLWFVGAMVTGMLVFRALDARRAKA